MVKTALEMIRSSLCCLHRPCINVPLKRYFNSISTSETVELAYNRVAPPNPSSETPGNGPIVVLHGLFGSKRNWTSVSKHFSTALKTSVYTIDLRNHGESPHRRPHTYQAMTSDMLSFFKQHNLRNVTLLGHSMGGKVAMSVALDPTLPSGTLKKLIVEDIAPSRGRMSSEFPSYVRAMQEIERANIRTRKEALEILQKTEPDPSVNTFLLTNLVTPDDERPYVGFRVPLDIISDHTDDMGDFPYSPGDRTWEGQTLFIKGSKSKYINPRNIPIAEQFFPNMRLETLESGHWVHAEPRSTGPFIDLVKDFYSSP